MIEIVHYMNRWGKKMTAVFPGLDTLTWLKDAPPQAETYMHRYHAGLEEAHHPLPAVIYHIYLPSEEEPGSIWEYTRFHCEPYEVTYNKRVHVLPSPPLPGDYWAAQLALQVCREFFADDDHPSTCWCETCRYWGA